MFPCPICGKQQGYLNAFNILSIRSYILVTNVTTSIVIACPGCISKSAKAQLVRNLLFGWWGIPWGPIRTVHSIFVNSRAIHAENHPGPTEEFVDSIKPYAGAIQARIDHIKDMNEILALLPQERLYR
jgi:hypothetical protein